MSRKRIERNEWYESLLLLKKDSPDEFSRLSQSVQLACEIYAERRGYADGAESDAPEAA
jgi:hypothetical protein